MPSVTASRAPLSFGGVPAMLAQFAQVAQSFALGKLLKRLVQTALRLTGTSYTGC